MITPNEDNLVPLEKAHEKFLQLLRLSAAVEQIAADDELFAFFFFKKTAFRQAVFQFVIKAVRIGGDIIFHAIPPCQILLGKVVGATEPLPVFPF